MELGQTFTRNHNDHLTEDTVVRDPLIRWWMGFVLDLGWRQGLA